MLLFNIGYITFKQLNIGWGNKGVVNDIRG